MNGWSPTTTAPGGTGGSRVNGLRARLTWSQCAGSTCGDTTRSELVTMRTGWSDQRAASRATPASRSS